MRSISYGRSLSRRLGATVYATSRDEAKRVRSVALTLASRLGKGDRDLDSILPVLDATGALTAARSEAERHAASAVEAPTIRVLDAWTSGGAQSVVGDLAAMVCLVAVAESAQDLQTLVHPASTRFRVHAADLDLVGVLAADPDAQCEPAGRELRDFLEAGGCWSGVMPELRTADGSAPTPERPATTPAELYFAGLFERVLGVRPPSAGSLSCPSSSSTTSGIATGTGTPSISTRSRSTVT